MGENNFLTCGISENYRWNAGADFWANSTGNHGPEARDFAASEWTAAGLGIEQCSEIGVVFCGGETGQDETTEVGGRTRQAGNIFATVNARMHRYR